MFARKRTLRGYSCAARRALTNSWISAASSRVGWKPALGTMNAATTSPRIGSGEPMTPASATAGCFRGATSTISTACIDILVQSDGFFAWRALRFCPPLPAVYETFASLPPQSAPMALRRETCKRTPAPICQWPPPRRPLACSKLLGATMTIRQRMRLSTSLLVTASVSATLGTLAAERAGLIERAQAQAQSEDQKKEKQHPPKKGPPPTPPKGPPAPPKPPPAAPKALPPTPPPPKAHPLPPGPPPPERR